MITEQLDTLMRQGISKQIFPGAVVFISQNKSKPYVEAFGDRSIEPDQKIMCRDTLFDIASLTKPIVTATLLMQLVETGELDLDTPLQSYFPQCIHAEITIRNLLTHSSGLPAWEATYLATTANTQVLDYLLQLPLAYPTGKKVIYSCLGYIILGKLIEHLTAKTLDKLAQEQIFVPLGMKQTRYNPPAAWQENCAATEYGNQFEQQMVNHQAYTWRNKMIVGVVHDVNCHYLDGVAGNAGLFSTAEDLAKFCQMLIAGGKPLLTQPSINEISCNHTLGLNESRGLGWSILDDGSLYHTGFTGTSIRINIKHQSFAILLTNRTHPDASKPGILAFREQFHRLI